MLSSLVPGRRVCVALVAATITISVAPCAHAFDLEIDGFASFMAGQVLDEKEIATVAGEPGDINGYDDQLSFTPDSLFAVQMYSNLDEGLSVTAQMVAKAYANWEPELVWGFLSYDVNSYFSIKAGRSRIPFFLFSDTIDVGYSYPWITPPHDIYILSGIDNIDGVNLQFTHEIGDWTSKLNLVGGNSFTNIRVGNASADIDTKQILDATWSVNRNWFTLQLSVAEGSATVDTYSQLIDAYKLLQIPITAQQLDLLTLTDDKTRFAGIGVYIDAYPWLWISEYTAIEIENSPMQHHRRAWYSTFGYRWKKITYHVTHIDSESPVDEKMRTMVANEIVSRFPDISGNELLDKLRDNTEFAYLTDENATSSGIGLRYDFHSSAALKVEYQRRDNKVFDTQPELILMGVNIVF